MSTQEISVMALNEGASSASQLNPIVNTVKVGNQNVELFRLTADSISSNAVSWNLGSKESVLLSRKLIVEMPFTFRVPELATERAWHFPLCLKADAMNRAVTNCAVSLNGLALNSQPEFISYTTQHFERGDEQLHNSFLALSGNTPDRVWADELTGNEGLAMDGIIDLQYANFKSMNDHDPSYPSRSATVVAVEKGGNTSVDGAGTKSAVYVNITARYAIKNPFFSSNAQDYLAGVRECRITLNFDSNNILAKAFFHPKIHGGKTSKAEITNFTGEIGKYSDLVATVSSKASSDFLLYGQTITPSPEYAHLIPLKQTVSAPDWHFAESQIGEVDTGNSTNVLHPSVDLQAVPSHIYLQAVPMTVSQSSKRTDYYGKISNLRLTVNNQTYTYTEWTDSDFYAMNVANGLKQPWYAFRTEEQSAVNSVDTAQRGVGAPLCFRPAKDLSGALIEGAQMPFKIEAKYTITNNSSVKQTFVSRIAFRTPATITLEKGMVATRQVGIPMSEVLEAKASGQVVPFSSEASVGNDELVGGGISSMLSGHRGSTQDLLSMLTPVFLSMASRDPRMAGLGLATELASSALGGGAVGGSTLGGSSRNDQLRSLGLSL